MVDNYEQIRKMLVWDDPDLFYFIQILQRKKENPQIGSNSVVIKDYFVGSLERFDSLEEEIKDLCNLFAARAMIRLNRRSYEQIHLKTIEKLVNQLGNKDYRSAKNAYASVCGMYQAEKTKSWIVDIDEKLDQEIEQDLIDFINACQPEGMKYLTKIPSKNGYHLITEPFNVQEFKSSLRTSGHILQDSIIDIHKDNPTNLYIPHLV